MQCPSCQFHNMPGTAVCGRCASPLAVSAAVSVHPPRAGRWAKRWRGLTMPRRAMNAARDAVAEHRLSFEPFTDRLPPWPVLGRTIVPGWAQLRAGQRWQGRLMLWSYLACLLPGLLTIGTTFGSVIIGSAFSVHVWSIADVLNQAFTDRAFRAQITRSIGACVLLALFVYAPAAWLLGWVVSPMTVNYTTGTFREGDVLLSCPLAEVRPGRTVVYTSDVIRTGRQEGHTYYVYTGDRVDRVLAGGGDVVVFKNGRLVVNGAEPLWQPLVPDCRVPDFSRTVPADSVLIVPSTTAGLIANAGGSIKDHLIVPRRAVRVVVFARSSPLRQWAWLN